MCRTQKNLGFPAAFAARAWQGALVALLVVLVAAPGALAGDGRLTVHEWGTFTSLQDENGRAMGGINIDDEPLPDFVHNLRRDLLKPTVALEYYDQKGAPQRHPLVTLRLETPVIYFYPPKNATLPLELDVHVELRGGWLTEFFPQAVASAPGIKQGEYHFGRITADTVSSLDWNDVRVGTEALGPKTDSHVWLAPRQTGAAGLTAASGESEKYLFYRGVGRFDSPLRISTSSDGQLSIRGNFGHLLAKGEEISVGPLWLVHIRHDGTSAFRGLDAVQATRDDNRVLATTAGGFSAGDYSKDNLAKMSDALHQALVADGLFADEATALLETWRQAYFKSPGLRVFSLVPRAWTDHRMPLRISEACDLERVMVARIELVSPEQRELMKKLRSFDKVDSTWVEKVYKSPHAKAFFAGRSTFGDLGVEIPADYQTYLDLGRFRNALVLAEEERRPSNNLTRFIHSYGLHSYKWSDDPNAAAE